jgi:subtilisin family serine protease
MTHLVADLEPAESQGARNPTIVSGERSIQQTNQAMQLMNHLFAFGANNPKVLVVAASGNDSNRGQGKAFGPRMPAAVEGVLGVSAARSNGEPASYSNWDDVENGWHDDGVSAFSGEAVQANDVSVTQEGLIGLYVSPFPDPSQHENKYGLASWTGTSFATPIVVGLAANLWSARPNATAREILDEICRLGPNAEVKTLMQTIS